MHRRQIAFLAALFAAGLAGCSGGDDAPAADPSGGGSAEIVVYEAQPFDPNAGRPFQFNPKNLDTTGPVTCRTEGGVVTIAIGPSADGIALRVTEGETPEVESISLGSVDGAVIEYDASDDRGHAVATKNGKSYTIDGVAVGPDAANQLVNRPFGVTATCP